MPLLSNPWAVAKQNTAEAAPSPIYRDCSSFLVRQTKHDSDEKLRGKLRHPDTLPKNAIAEIVNYLAAQQAWDGEFKYEKWQEYVQFYNHRRTLFWINAPSMLMEDGNRVAWAETRGHLLVFMKTGEVFTSFNPERPNPHQGFRIDWSDPTLRRR